jgi:hypothetical protein
MLLVDALSKELLSTAAGEDTHIRANTTEVLSVVLDEEVFTTALRASESKLHPFLHTKDE